MSGVRGGGCFGGVLRLWRLVYWVGKDWVGQVSISRKGLLLFGKTDFVPRRMKLGTRYPLITIIIFMKVLVPFSVFAPDICARDGADLKNKLIGVMVYF